MSSQCAFDSTIRRSGSRARNVSPIARIAALTRATCALSSVSGRVRNCGACGTIAAPTIPGRLSDLLLIVVSPPLSPARRRCRAGRCPALGEGHYATVAAPPAKDVAMSAERNAPPKTGWANMVTELHVADLAASLAFWTDIIGFDIAFRRNEENFVYLEHPEGQQMMLCQRHGRFETGPMQPPLGQGAMLQLHFRHIGAVLARLAARNWPICRGPREVWRRTGDRAARP